MIQPGMSLNMEAAWTERKTSKLKKINVFVFKFLEICAFLPVHADSILSDMSG